METYQLYEVMDVVFRDIVTKKPVFYFDTLKMSTVNVTGEQTSQTGGKGNAELFIADHSRKATIDITDALISMTSLAMLAGRSKASKGARIITAKQDFNFDKLPGGTPGAAPTGGKITITNVTSNNGGNIGVKFDGQERVFQITNSKDKDVIAGEIANAINALSLPYTAAAQGGSTGVVNFTTTVEKTTITIEFDPKGTGITANTTNFTGGTNATPPAKVDITLAHKPIKGTAYLLNPATEDITEIAAGDTETDAKKVGLRNLSTLRGSVIYQYEAKQTNYVIISSETFPGYFEVEGSTMEIDTCSGKIFAV